MLKLMKSNHRTTRWPAVLLAAALLAAACGGDGDDRSAEEAAQARAEAAAAQAAASDAQSQAADAQAAAAAAAAELADARQALETAQAEAADAMEGGEASQEELAQARAELEAAEQAAEEARSAAEEAEAAVEAAEEARAAAEAEAEAALAAAATTTTAAPAGPSTGREGTVIIGKRMASDTTFDPAIAFEELYVTVLGSVYDHLVSWAETANGYDYQTLEPELATEWSSNADATQWTFVLDPDARFHDSSPVTSEDVRWSFMRFKNKAGPPSYQAANIESIDTPDDQTVVIDLAGPDAEFPGLMTAAAFAVLNSDMVAANGGTAGEDAAETDTAEEWLTLNSAGSGPFRIAVSDPGVRLELERVPDYWAGPPAVIERVIFTNIPEAQSRIDALARGDIDLAWTVIPHQAAPLGDGFTILQANTNHWYYVAFTTDPANHPFIADPMVQKALKLAIDYDGLQQLCPGFPALRAYGLAPMRLGGITSGYERDLDAAKALLAEAGYPDGYGPSVDGYQQIRLQTFQWTGFCPLFGDVVQKLAQDWRDIDVITDVQIRDAGVFFTDFRNGDLDINVSDWFPEFPSAVSSASVSFPGGVVAGRARWGPDTPGRESWQGWPNYEEIEALGEATLAAIDMDERIRLLNETERLSLESNPVHLLTEVPEWYPHTNSLTGVYYHAVYRFEPYRMGRAGS